MTITPVLAYTVFILFGALTVASAMLACANVRPFYPQDEEDLDKPPGPMVPFAVITCALSGMLTIVTAVVFVFPKP